MEGVSGLVQEVYKFKGNSLTAKNDLWRHVAEVMSRSKNPPKVLKKIIPLMRRGFEDGGKEGVKMASNALCSEIMEF